MISTVAAVSYFCGGSLGWKLLNSTDRIERDLIVELSKRIQKMKEIESHNLAVEIASQVSKMFKR